MITYFAQNISMVTIAQPIWKSWESPFKYVKHGANIKVTQTVIYAIDEFESG